MSAAFLVLVLICAGFDGAACQQDTAVDQISVPGGAPDPARCMFVGQAYIAGTALKPPVGSMLKVICTQNPEAKGGPGR